MMSRLEWPLALFPRSAKPYVVRRSWEREDDGTRLLHESGHRSDGERADRNCLRSGVSAHRYLPGVYHAGSLDRWPPTHILLHIVKTLGGCSDNKHLLSRS